MKTYTIIAGVNGTGKSSLTGSLKAQTKSPGTIIDTDKITAEAGVSPLAGGKIALKQFAPVWSVGFASLRRAPCPVISPTKRPAKPEKPEH